MTAATLAALVPCALSAQDSLRVLRLTPHSPAAPTAPVVVMFDHPVAPRLDNSIDPSRVLRITPEVGTRIYWRDPSTIVAEFESAWAPGATYEVHLDRGLKSVDGLRLAAEYPFRVHVERPRAFGLVATSGGEADTVLRPLAVYSGAFDLSLLAGNAWFVPRIGCATRDSLPVAATEMRRLTSADPWRLTEGNYERDRRSDSLRRVVELSVPGYVKRGCHGEIHLPLVIGERAPIRVEVAVRPAFALDSIFCASGNCEHGAIALRFTNAVTAAMVRAHVRVDGRPAQYLAENPSGTITLLDQVQARLPVRITVDGAMESAVGEPLRRETTAVLTGNPYAAAVGFASGVVSTPRDAPVLMRVRHVNTDSVIVVIGRVPDSLRARAIAQGDFDYYYHGGLRWADIARDTVVHAIPTEAPEDSQHVIDLPLALVPQAWRDDPLLIVRMYPVGALPRTIATSGMPRIVLRPKPGDVTPRYAIVRRSNLAVHARATHGDIDVWVTSLRDARSRSGATVRLLDNTRRVLATAVTDARGRARLRSTTRLSPEQRLFHLDVALGDDRTLLLVANGAVERIVGTDDDPQMLTFRYWGAVDEPWRFGTRWLHGSAFADRGIYRPGERVYLGGAARTFAPDEGYRIPAVDSARWTVWHRNSDGVLDRVWSHTGRLSDFGVLTDSFTIERTARLGEYVATLAVRNDTSWRTAARTEFRVAEYRAPEFAVRLETDTSTMVFGGDSASVRVQARYLFGLPMAGGTVQWWTVAHERQPWELNIHGLSGFTVGRSNWADGAVAKAATHNEGRGTIGDDGTIRLRIPTDTMSRPGTVAVTITAADVNRQAVTSETTIPVHAANAYVGMRTRERRWLWKPRDSIAVELLLVRPDGTPRVGENVSVMALEWRSTNGKWKQDTIWRTTATTAATPVSVAFVPRDGGSYEIVGEAHDERGRRATTGLGLWVTGANPWWYAENPRTITMRTDRPRYVPGDTASVIVDSPAEQRAWLTVGHEGTLSEQFVSLHSGINDIRVEIPQNAGESVTIRMMAVRPFGPRGGEDSAGIYHRSGVLTIPVDTTSRSLHVVVTSDRTRYGPRDSVRVGIDVRNAKGAGRVSDLTVWAVDEGVVALTSFVRPAVLAALLAGSGDTPWSGSTLLAWMLTTPPGTAPSFLTASEFDMLQGRAGSIRLRGASMMALSEVVVSGTATNTADAPLRNRFATTPFFTGHVRSDNSGHATTTFMLPDNVTAFRIYAVAIGEDVSAGSGDTSIISTRDLVVRPALPRIVRAGDQLFAGAVLTKEGTGRVPVSLRVEARNAQVLDSATLRDTLDGQRPRELRFPLRITGGDTATFTFHGTTLSGATANDAVEAKLAVSPPGRARAHVVTGMLERTDVATLAVPAGTDTARSHVSLQLGVSPLPLVQQFSEALRIYPYYCTEQVSSAGRGLLARLKLERGSTPPPR